MITMAKGKKGDDEFVIAELEVGQFYTGQGVDELAALRDLLIWYTEDMSAVLNEIDNEIERVSPKETLEQWLFEREGEKVKRESVSTYNNEAMWAESESIAISLILQYAVVRFTGTQKQADYVFTEAQKMLGADDVE